MTALSWAVFCNGAVLAVASPCPPLISIALPLVQGQRQSTSCRRPQSALRLQCNKRLGSPPAPLPVYLLLLLLLLLLGAITPCFGRGVGEWMDEDTVPLCEPPCKQPLGGHLANSSWASTASCRRLPSSDQLGMRPMDSRLPCS